MRTELPTNFHEGLRYEYDLTPDSLVIDCGFYKGEFTMEMARRYDCWIEAYEPVKEFWQSGIELVKKNPKICLRNHGVGRLGGRSKLNVKGALTGDWNFEGPLENVKMNSIRAVMDLECDLLKLNVEGAEFEILEAMLDYNYNRGISNLVGLVDNIQVQFHQVVPNFQERYEAIRAKLLETHHLTFDFPWCWENYRRNDAD